MGAAERLEEHVKSSIDANAAVRQKAALALGTFLTHLDETLRRKASKALAEMGADAAPAATALEQAAKDADDEVRKFARQSLIRLLAVDLKAKEPAKQIRALEQIALYGAEANVVGAELIEAMQDKTPAVQVAACESLEKVNPKVQKHVFTIFFGMNKQNALDDLGDLGKEATIALPQLFHMIATAQMERSVGYDSLRKLFRVVAAIDPKDKRFAVLVLAAVEAPDLHLRCLGMDYLNKIEVETAAKVKALVKALGDGIDTYAVIRALEGYGKEAASALPLLRKLKLSPNDAIREVAREVVEKIE